jgi:hypothetical protein
MVAEINAFVDEPLNLAGTVHDHLLNGFSGA